MKNKIFLIIFVLGIIFTPVFFLKAQTKETSSVSAGFSKVVDFIENFRRDMIVKFEAQKIIFENKANVQVDPNSLDKDETTNYIKSGSADKVLSPIFKALAFVFFGLVLIFSSYIIFYLVLFFFVFILLRYLWRRAV